jgi:regulator of cell morphogenesis and NO signaling
MATAPGDASSTSHRAVGSVARAIGLLDALAAEPDGAGPAAAHDVAGLRIGELCDHIVSSHHDRLREDLPQITDLLSTVVRVHGGEHPELLELQRCFAVVREDLETHMRLEEESLFPACRALDGDGRAGPLDHALLVMLEDDHSTTGDALATMRELTGGHRTDSALCATHRRLLKELLALEHDVHQHVHEENNVLFARVRARAGDRGNS